MANSSSKATILANLTGLLLSLLLIFSMAESRFFGVGFEKGEIFETPVCVKVFGARENDTCFSVSQAFNLTADSFNSINPNITCDKIFVGQWLCVEGILT